MSYIQRHTVAVTTDGSGDVTAYTAANITGTISQIRYVKTDFADGSTITWTVEATGETVWGQTGVNASATVAPRQATHSTAGAAALYAGGGSAVLDKITVANSRLKVVVSGGGDTKTGTFHILVE
jgi:hypothetical protein